MAAKDGFDPLPDRHLGEGAALAPAAESDPDRPVRFAEELDVPTVSSDHRVENVVDHRRCGGGHDRFEVKALPDRFDGARGAEDHRPTVSENEVPASRDDRSPDRAVGIRRGYP